MKRGDVILTPTWNWHDHGNDDTGPMIWLDGLDLPNFVHFPVHFVEHYQDSRYPAEDVDTRSSPLVFPWDKMQESLDNEGGAWAWKRYLREDGNEGMVPDQRSICRIRKLTKYLIVSRVLGGQAEKLDRDSISPLRRETSSCVYHVISGNGSTVLDDKTVVWKQGDTFCIPSWQRYQHKASAAETVYLYRFDDQPMLKALGFYRDEATDSDSLVSS
jgi:gentisate 1,2-dioxygenase